MYPDIGRTRGTVDSSQLFENIGGHALDPYFLKSATCLAFFRKWKQVLKIILNLSPLNELYNTYFTGSTATQMIFRQMIPLFRLPYFNRECLLALIRS